MAGKDTVGLMTTTYGHSRVDVRRWPDDPDVRQTLEEYLDYLDKLDGAALQRWFAERGAPLVEVRQPAQQ
jgi:hypothetical protein